MNHQADIRQVTTTELWRWKIMYWYGLAAGMVYLYLQFHYEPPTFGYSNYSCSLNGGIPEALNHIHKMFKGQSSSQHHINTTCNVFLHAFFFTKQHIFRSWSTPNLARWPLLPASPATRTTHDLQTWWNFTAAHVAHGLGDGLPHRTSLEVLAKAPGHPGKSRGSRCVTGFAFQSMAISIGKLRGMEWGVIFQAVVHWNLTSSYGNVNIYWSIGKLNSQSGYIQIFQVIQNIQFIVYLFLLTITMNEWSLTEFYCTISV